MFFLSSNLRRPRGVWPNLARLRIRANRSEPSALRFSQLLAQGFSTLLRSWRLAVNRLLVGGWQIHPEENRTLLAAGLLFFILLTSLMILRPVRDTLGMARGLETNRRLFLVTVAFTLLVTPLFGWLASRVSRRRLIATVFRGCAFLLLAFLAGITVMPEPIRGLACSGYYVFYSVFNLLVVSLFWTFMVDHFSLTESKRLFPVIALGGSLGAILGSLISWQLVRHFGIGSLFPPAALLLELAVWVSFWFAKIHSPLAHLRLNGPSIGGSWLAGVKAVMQSSYIRGIGGFVALTGLITTFLYFTGLRLVAAASSSPEQQTVLFAHINLWTQLATLMAQTLLAGPIMRVAGVGTALAVLPALGAFGAAMLALAPTLLVFTVVNAVFRAAQQGITGPAQETLFTVLERQEKYKAKSFLDTFGYRAVDASGAHLEGIVSALGPGLLPFATSVFGLAALWLALGVFLGRAQNRLANRLSPRTPGMPVASFAKGMPPLPATTTIEP
jgi:ATP:ADP antiporter, AAA family